MRLGKFYVGRRDNTNRTLLRRILARCRDVQIRIAGPGLACITAESDDFAPCCSEPPAYSWVLHEDGRLEVAR